MILNTLLSCSPNTYLLVVVWGEIEVVDTFVDVLRITPGHPKQPTHFLRQPDSGAAVGGNVYARDPLHTTETSSFITE